MVYSFLLECHIGCIFQQIDSFSVLGFQFSVTRGKWNLGQGKSISALHLPVGKIKLH